jgi:multidrug efflux pump subunit AcrA (membrane-fusion protein)
MKPLTLHSRLIGIAALSTMSVALISGCGKGQGADSAAKAAAQPSTPVFVAPVTTGTIAQTIPVTGNLMTLYTVNLSPQTAGKLINVFVREGDQVKKGEVVAEIDPTTAIASVDQDQANVESAQAKVDQAEATYNQSKIAARVGISNAKSSVSAAQINLQSAGSTVTTAG